MPKVPIEQLSESARVWVFGANETLNEQQSGRLLGVVDNFLADWAAHGSPLEGARELRDGRFLIVAVDPGTSASGCSIDKLFATLQSLEGELAVSLVDSGRLFFRNASGAVQSVDRSSFRDLVGRGEISGSTPVFDTTIEHLAELRSNHFEKPVSDSWHALAFPIPDREPATR